MEINDERRRAATDLAKENARRRIAEWRKEHPGWFGGWLNSGRPFDHGLKLPAREQAQAETLFREITKDMRLYSAQKKIEHFGILCANLLSVYGIGQSRPIAISMSPNHWTKDRYRTAGQFVLKAVSLLIDEGLINYKLGTEAAGRYTRIWPKQEFLMRFPIPQTEHQYIDYMPPEFVVLRDSSGNLMDYNDTKETDRIRKILRTNHIIDHGAKIQVHRRNSFFTLNIALHAVFNENWHSGGRLYTSTRFGYQQLERKERKLIYINHEPTVELDYSGLHPRMLYAWEGIQFDGDPYTVVHDNPQLRPLLKGLLLAFLNADSDTKAVSAGNNEIHEMCQNGDYTFYPLDAKFGVTVKELLRRFKEAHEPISRYFCSGIANKVMNADSKIALSIIEHFGNRRIPILAIHDSFIVQARYRDELYRVMDKVYRGKTGGFTCPIKDG